MSSKLFLKAQWKYLAMINYEIEPRILLPFVPQGTELDSWNGRTLISVVGFLFWQTRVLGLKIPFHHSFEEVNLRFYVRRKTEIGWPARNMAGWRRGVVFIKEIVPRSAIAVMARVLYNENYTAMPMRHRIEEDHLSEGQAGTLEYGWRYKGKWNHLRVSTIGKAHPIGDGSEEEFITEHYWGYAKQRDGGTVEYQVEHPRWLVWQTNKCQLNCDVKAIYSERFVETLSAPPSSAFVALGSEIVVRRGIPLA